MDYSYETITGMDFSDTKKKITAEKDTENYFIKTKYEKFSEHPAEPPKPVELAKVPDDQPDGKTFMNITPAKLFIAFGCLAILMIVWIWEIASVREGLAAAEQLKEKKMELQKANEALQVEITRLSANERIEKMATEQLHMIHATEKPGVIFIDGDKGSAADNKKESDPKN
jgi:cell division protein FtsL